jgi:hypothetical protein
VALNNNHSFTLNIWSVVNMFSVFMVWSWHKMKRRYKNNIFPCLTVSSCFSDISKESCNFTVLAHWSKQSTVRHVIPLRHIILIPRQLVFAPIPKYCVLSREAENINFIVFGLTRPELNSWSTAPKASTLSTIPLK